MNKLFIIASLILALPSALFPAADQVTEQIPQAPALPPAPAQPPYVRGNEDLSDEDYASCMHVTQQINPEIYTYLLGAEKKGIRCFKKHKYENLGRYISIKKPGFASHGYPVFLICTKLTNFSPQELHTKLEEKFKIWHSRKPDTSMDNCSMKLYEHEQQAMFNLLYKLAPELYEKIMAANISIRESIFCRFSGMYAGTLPSGFPKIFIHPKSFFTYPREKQLFILAHELSHYALGHVMKTKTPPLKHIIGNDYLALLSANARVTEYEADYHAVASFNADPDAGANNLQSTQDSYFWTEKDILESQIIKKDRPNFPSSYSQLPFSHPHPFRRRDELKRLATDCTTYNPRKPIDWNELIQEHADWYASVPHLRTPFIEKCKNTLRLMIPTSAALALIVFTVKTSAKIITQQKI